MDGWPMSARIYIEKKKTGDLCLILAFFFFFTLVLLCGERRGKKKKKIKKVGNSQTGLEKRDEL